MKIFNNTENIDNTEISVSPTRARFKPIDTDGNFKLFSTISYREYYFGDFYDPDEHIYQMNRIKKQECFKLTKIYNNFALYLNYPIYKRESIDNENEIFIDTLNKAPLSENSIMYTETMFDLTNQNNFIKLKKPIPSIHDGQIHKQIIDEEAEHV